MNASTILWIVALLIIVLAAVVAYNMYQENQFRQKMRHQFGHADNDALMNTQTASVRDGQTFASDGVRSVKKVEKNAESTATPVAPLGDDSDLSTEVVHESESEQPPKIGQPESEYEAVASSQILHPSASNEEMAAVTETHQAMDEPTVEPIAPKKQATQVMAALSGRYEGGLLAELEELARNDLIWFDKRFDFMAYVALTEPRELQAIPRLSIRQRFQIIGCTRDGRFQPAEPIPGVLYQAFVIGLQGISRTGLVGMEELNHFTTQVQHFANNMGGRMMVEDAETFLEQIIELDQLCAGVDNIIGVYLASKAGVSGIELHQALAQQGFVLEEGRFVYYDAAGNDLYSIKPLNGSAFNEALLASQRYKGFGMFFDVTRVPNGEQNFNYFMRVAVKLSSDLRLELVDNQLQTLPTEWLKEVQNYVGIWQQEMKRAGIEPAGLLAKRLFA